MHEFQSIEDGVLALLSPLSSLGLRTLASYSGELEAEDLAEIVYQFPCMYVIAPELDLTERNRYDAYVAHFTLIVGDRNLRGAAEAARGRLHGKRIVSGWTPSQMVMATRLIMTVRRFGMIPWTLPLVRGMTVLT